LRRAPAAHQHAKTRRGRDVHRFLVESAAHLGHGEKAVSGAGELDAYFGEAASWDADRASESRRSAKRAWIVAAAGWLCAVGSGAAIVLLTPLKTVEPFVIRVDNSTGIVDVVPVYAGKAEMGQTVTRYLLAHYVTVCQRFAFATVESDY
jgi:type IV secretion system protein VirB8